MKRALVGLLLLSTGFSAFAQNFAQTNQLRVSPVFTGNVSMPLNDLAGRRLRKTGMVLTIAGIGFTIGGIIARQDAESPTNLKNGTGYDAFLASVIMYAAGAGMGITGITLCVVGASKMKKSSQRKEISFNLKGPGISLRYRS